MPRAKPPTRPDRTFSRSSVHGQVAHEIGLKIVRGELAPMRDIAEIIKGEVEARPRSPEAGVAARLNGTTDWFAGDFADAARFAQTRARDL